MRKRWTLTEQYQLDVHEMAKLILSSANSYEDIEGCSKAVALERAISDYSFWYNGNGSRLKELEIVLYGD